MDDGTGTARVETAPGAASPAKTGAQRRRSRLRHVYVAAGAATFVFGVLIIPLPGPTGLPVMAVGAVIMMRHSHSARRRFVRLSRRYPGYLGPLRRLLARRKPHRKPPVAAPASA